MININVSKHDLESIGVRLLIFEKIWRVVFLKNDRNALIDVKSELK